MTKERSAEAPPEGGTPKTTPNPTPKTTPQTPPPERRPKAVVHPAAPAPLPKDYGGTPKRDPKVGGTPIMGLGPQNGEWDPNMRPQIGTETPKGGMGPQ